MPTSPFYAGVMSGTSLDAVDAVLLDFSVFPPTRCATASLPFNETLRQEILALHHPSHNELARAALVANQLADVYSQALQQLSQLSGIAPTQIAAAGVHGQTVRHEPTHGYTLQLNAPARIAEQTGLTIVADFRSRDIAAGGQGAPLVPAFHAALFRHHAPCAILNLGGIANFTLLAADGAVRGFDTGPANILLDAWIQHIQNQPFDRAGTWAAQGQVIPALLTRLRSEPYFAQPAPKSTGRDLFNLHWLQQHLHEIGHSTVATDNRQADVQATLLELTASTIVDALNQYQPETERVLLCGGGAHNVTLVQRLQALKPCVWQSTAQHGIEPQWVEASAFAWLARQTLLGETGNLPSVTGAHGARILGAIYPQ